jgi:tetratricopeptide (TPR) repeat protein
MPRDLETICLKCLEKDIRKRYANALALAEDLHRYLGGETIRARPAGRLERAAKWARRRPAMAGLIAVSALALLGLLSVWGWLTVQLQEERDRALREHERAEANFQMAFDAVEKMLTKVAAKTLAKEPRMKKKQEELLDAARVFYEQFLKDRGDDPLVREKAALAYKYLGDIQRLLNRREQAQRAYERAIALLEQLAAARPRTPEYRHHLAESYNWLGELLRTEPRPAEARVAFLKAMEHQRQLITQFPHELRYQKDLARTHYNLGLVFKDINEPEKADEAFAHAIGILEEVHQQDRRTPEFRAELARCLFNWGLVLADLNQFAKAKAVCARSVVLLQGLRKDDPNEPDYLHDLVVAHNNAAYAWFREKAPEADLAGHVAILSGTEATGLARPVWVGTWLASPRWGRLLTAQKYYEEALVLAMRLVADHPGVPVYAQEQATTYINLGAVQAAWGQKPQAIMSWKKARDLQEALVKEFPKEPAYRGDLAMTLYNLGWLRNQAGDWDRAAQDLEEGVTQVRVYLKHNSKNQTYLEVLRLLYRELGESQLRRGKHHRAGEAARALVLVEPERKDEYVRAARLLARCLESALHDPTLTESKRDEQLRGYVQDAVRLLREAHQRGYPGLVALMETHQDFQSLRSLPEFKALLGELQK